MVDWDVDAAQAFADGELDKAHVAALMAVARELRLLQGKIEDLTKAVKGE
ncbi:hypothetical protein [Nonomuraea sp. NPDC049725]